MFLLPADSADSADRADVVYTETPLYPALCEACFCRPICRPLRKVIILSRLSYHVLGRPHNSAVACLLPTITAVISGVRVL